MWFGLRDKTQLLYAPQVQARLLKAEDDLRAEKALTAQYEMALRKSLDMQSELLVTIAKQRIQLERLDELEGKLQPIAQELRDWCRGQQHSFVGGDEEC